MFKIIDTNTKKELSQSEIEKIARRDGFKSAEDMFNYFDKEYDLSSPKRFYVYRFRWLKWTNKP